MCASRPRWALQLEAMTWRNLMGIGMYIHTFSHPQPEYPSFTRTIETTVSKKYPGTIKLHFYCPPAYVIPDDDDDDDDEGSENNDKKEGGGTVEELSRQTTSSSSNNGNNLKVPSSSANKKGNNATTTTVDPAASTLSLATAQNRAQSLFPVVLSFHGGGFTIGSATDDARWAHAVTTLTNAVVVAVDYRLAPEFPFPTAIEDGVDALMYLVDHADELQLDVKRIVTSGFSAGGNMAFTVPLRWQYELRSRMGMETDLEGGTTELPREAAARGSFCAVQPGVLPPMSAVVNSPAIPTIEETNQDVNDVIMNGNVTLPQRHRSSNMSGTGVDANGVAANVCAVCAWYPSVDYTNSREHRRMTNVRVDKGMPKFFTDLFDASYLYPPKEISMSNPYLSPAVAPQGMLKGLPRDIMMYTCEWDELLAEAERLRTRLDEELGKDVVYKKVMGVGHGWDKAPWGHEDLRKRMYKEACKGLRKVFYGSEEEIEGLESPYKDVGDVAQGETVDQHGAATPNIPPQQ